MMAPMVEAARAPFPFTSVGGGGGDDGSLGLGLDLGQSRACYPNMIRSLRANLASAKPPALREGEGVGGRVPNVTSSPATALRLSLIHI